MNRITKFELLALAIIVIACAMLFGLVAPAGAQDVITEAEFNACMEGWDRLIDDGNPLTRGQLYVLRYRYCVGIDDSSVSDEAPEEETQPPQEDEYNADLIVICKTPDTGGIILPGDMSPESRILSVMVNGQEEFQVRAGLSGNELIIRSAQWFPQGTVLEIEGEHFILDPDFRDNTQTWCYRDAA